MSDRGILVVLQALLVGMPLLLGGRHPVAATVGPLAALALLAATLQARRRAGGGPAAVGVGALAAFAALAFATTVPLPPALFTLLSPSAARLTAAMLPGWPDAGAFSRWRPLALDAYAVWVELGRLALGFAVFTTIVAYPWRAAGASTAADGDERALARLVPTLVIGASGIAAVGLLAAAVGNGRVLWITAEPTTGDRVSGPFVNPNHFAAWLAMVIPLTLAYALSLASRLRRRLAQAAASGRGMGVRRERAWAAAFIANQRALAAPLAAAAAAALLVVTLIATGSRGGLAALLVGLGSTGAGMAARARRRSHAPRRGRAGRMLPAGLALLLAAAAAATLVRWATTEDLADDGLEVNLSSRLAVAAQGTALLREYPLAGSGLGSWLHAYRPHQAPPVEGGIWDHAHDDYLELAAETGIAGVAIVVAFFVAVARTLLVDRGRRRAAAERAERRRCGNGTPPGFEVPEWRAALRDRGNLRWGFVGGIAAILIQSSVDFALHLPASFLLMMTLGALLVVANRPRAAAAAAAAEPPALLVDPAADLAAATAQRRRGASPILALTALLAVAASIQAANGVRVLAGATPLAPAAALEQADLVLAAGGNGSVETALALVRTALDRAPADRAAHEAEAAVLGTGPEAEAAWRRAIALSPWAPELHDGLALALWQEDRRDAALAEIEESMFRYPYLVSHAYLGPASDVVTRGAGEWLRVLAEGDTLALRLAALDDALASAIRRGLERALAASADGPVRAAIVDDLATLLEAREHFADAAAMLRAEAERSEDGRAYLARAGRAALAARDLDGAEATLLAALTRTPEQGRLYRDLALGVYAARGDFESAETVLRAGERNAVDLLPIHRGVSELVVRRESSRRREAAAQ